jgi:hypothetical protein
MTTTTSIDLVMDPLFRGVSYFLFVCLAPVVTPSPGTQPQAPSPAPSPRPLWLLKFLLSKQDFFFIIGGEEVLFIYCVVICKESVIKGLFKFCLDMTFTKKTNNLQNRERIG